jgi:hypothetical protein
MRRDLSRCDGWRFLRLVPHQHLFSEHIDFALFRHHSGEPLAVAGPPQFVEVENGAPVEPMFRLHHTEAQELMDLLWHIGLRPTQGRQSEGQVAAVERHLADMRAIAFSKLEVKQP